MRIVFIFPDFLKRKLVIKVKIFYEKIAHQQYQTLQKIKELLKNDGIDFQEYEIGIQLTLEQFNLPRSFLDIYILKSNPEHLRARIRRLTSNKREDRGGDEEVNEFSIHTQADLEYLRNEFQEILSKIIQIGRFHYFGCRNGVHYYYAQITLEGEVSNFVLRGKFTEKAIAQLKGVDSKVFRQALDTLGIPRSSIIRLSLTRIFRDADDAAEFFLTVSKEAERIVNADEWRTLRDLKKQSQIAFLNNIICILWEEVSKIYMKKAWLSLHQ